VAGLMNALDQKRGAETSRRWYWRYRSITRCDKGRSLMQRDIQPIRQSSRIPPTVTSRQFWLVDPGIPVVNPDSSSQSPADSLACREPINSLTALMNADNSRSAKSIWSVRVELLNDSSVFMGLSPLQIYWAAMIAARCHERITSETSGRNN